MPSNSPIKDWINTTSANRSKEVFDFFGSAQRLAELLDYPQKTVNAWKHRGKIPRGAAEEIEKRTRGMWSAAYIAPSVKEFFEAVDKGD